MSFGSMVRSPDHSRAALGWALGVGIVSVGLVTVDQLTGPFIRVTLGFALMVAVVAYRWNWPVAVSLGFLFGVSRLWLVLGSDVPWLVAPEVVNFGVNLLLFGAVAATVRFVVRPDPALSQDAVPVCGGCGRVRDTSARWIRFESFVTTVASARFHHTVCPECESRFDRSRSTSGWDRSPAR